MLCTQKDDFSSDCLSFMTSISSQSYAHCTFCIILAIYCVSLGFFFVRSKNEIILHFVVVIFLHWAFFSWLLFLVILFPFLNPTSFITVHHFIFSSLCVASTVFLPASQKEITTIANLWQLLVQCQIWQGSNKQSMSSFAHIQSTSNFIFQPLHLWLFIPHKIHISEKFCTFTAFVIFLWSNKYHFYKMETAKCNRRSTHFFYDFTFCKH